MTTNPADNVKTAVDRILELAQTWIVWDGIPRMADDGVRIYTPHKAIRRHTHHLIDHLAEIEALLSEQDSRPDEWLGSGVTLAGDLAPFTEADFNEARQCLLRLADLYMYRLTAAGPDEWDRPRDGHWSIRVIAEHVGDAWYADQVGKLI